jgi:predicted metalloendopeptidase
MRSSVKNSIDYKSLIDNSFRPQDDFYGYVNNKWLATNPIPKSESRWGTFVYLQNQSFKNMREIYKNLVGKDFRTGSIEQIARDFYESGMKIDDYRSQHLSLISDYFDKINSIINKSELWGLIGELNTIDTECCWGVWVGIDDKESTHYILHFTQPDLTLPNRDYYIVNNQSMESIRQKYQAHAKKSLLIFRI